MSYITNEDVLVKGRIKCTHPRVRYIWDYGFCSQQPHVDQIGYGIGIILTDETQQRFTGNEPEEVKNKAEEFLKTLNP